MPDLKDYEKVTKPMKTMVILEFFITFFFVGKTLFKMEHAKSYAFPTNNSWKIMVFEDFSFEKLSFDLVAILEYKQVIWFNFFLVLEGLQVEMCKILMQMDESNIKRVSMI